MRGIGELRSVAWSSVPYVVLTLNQLSLAAFMALLSAVVDPNRGISSTILVLYEHLVSSPLLLILALLFESKKRPPLTLRVFAWVFVLGFLQIPLEQLLLTTSLRYITTSFQSVAINTTPVVVLVLAIIFRREKVEFWGLNGQAKVWGILTSAAGATIIVFASDPERQVSSPTAASAGGGWSAVGVRLLGCAMVGLGVLSSALANLFVERVAVSYGADLTLSAMMNICGTVQTLIIAAITEREASSWRVQWGSMQLLAILYGGIAVTGISYMAQIWCIRKKGPVFGTAFYPLLVVFSFLLESAAVGRIAHPLSILGAVLVIGGLYLLLWAKSRSSELDRSIKGGQCHVGGSCSTEPLLPSKA